MVTIDASQTRHLPGIGHQDHVPAAAEVSPLTRGALIEQYLPMAYKLAGRWRRHRSFEHDDFTQIGMLAVIDAIDTFDPTRDCKLSTYVFRRIKWMLLDHVNGIRRRIGSTSAPAADVADASADLVDLDHDDDDSLLQDAIGGLPRRDKAILRRYYGLGGERPEISQAVADRFHLSRATVSHSLIRSRETLRAALSA